MQGIYYLLFVYSYCFSVVVRRAYTAQGPWPRPDSLVGFWPLDGQSKCRDIANDHITNCEGQLVTQMDGPFAQPNSSYTTDGYYVFWWSSVPFVPTFTISFFFFTGAKGRGGIYMLQNSWGGVDPRFVINYLEPNYLELWGGPACAIEIGKFPILTPNQWNFVAVAYDNEKGKVSIFDMHGTILAEADVDITFNEETTDTTQEPTTQETTQEIPEWFYHGETGRDSLLGEIAAAQTTDEITREKMMEDSHLDEVGRDYAPTSIAIGRTLFNGRPDSYYDDAWMKKTDAIACIMHYNDVLSPEEIAELPYHCQTKGYGTPRPTTTTSRPTPPVTPWPRPQSLLGFWPLNSQYSSRDVGPNRFDGALLGQLTFGPFGDESTAVSSKSGSESLLQVKNAKLLVEESFTVAMFFRRLGDAPGGIFEFLDSFGTKKAFQFRYENSTTIEVSANGVTIGHYTMIQQKGAWSFIAFVFDDSTSMLTVYSRHGVVSPASFQAHILASTSFNNNGVRLGYSTRWQQGLQRGDAISCLMVYSAALSPAEIRQVQDACRVIHGSATCGSPRLALSPIPPATSLTTIPKPGQFPYIALLRFGSILCSASIIDQYWLLTSSRCFSESKIPSHYKIYVGEHDMGVAEAHTREHSCSKIILSGSSAQDVALVQVSEPIDFTNEYVNGACLYREEQVGELKLDTMQFVFGWGENGRKPLVSTTLPRYVPGNLLTDKQCTASWGDGNYKSGRDFCFISASLDKNVPCSGDEGTPLLVQAHANDQAGKSDRLVEIGLYYKRDANCTFMKPPLFTNVALFSKWMAEKLACAVPGVAYPDKCPQ